MPPTLVAVAFGGLLAAALLGPAFDGRSVALVCGAAAFPDLDRLAGLLAPDLANTLLHTLALPASAGAALYYDLRVRERSWLRDRYGPAGVRVAWVGLAALALAGIGLDLLNVEGAAALYPLDDTRYSVVGALAFSTTEGIVQTYLTVNLGGGPLLSVATAPPPRPFYDPATGRASLVLVESGWQLVVLLAGGVALAGRALFPPSPPPDRPAGTPVEGGSEADGEPPGEARPPPRARDDS